MTPRLVMSLGLALAAGLVLAFAAILGLIPWLTAEIAGRLLFGWASFLARVTPWAWSGGQGLNAFLIGFVLITAALLGACLRLTRSPRPVQAEDDPRHCRGGGFRRSVALLAAFLVMAAAGLAAASVALEAAGLASARGRWVVMRQAYRPWPSRWHLSQIAMAVTSYASVYETLPYLRSDPQGRFLHSWQTAILPYTFEGMTVGQIDRERPWDDPRNSAYFRGIVFGYLNSEVAPIRDARGYALSHFAGNVHVLGRTRPLRLEGVTNGAAHTMLAGEAADGFKAWGDPTNVRSPLRGIGRGPERFCGPAGADAQLVFLDGSVRTVTRTASPQVLRRMAYPTALRGD